MRVDWGAEHPGGRPGAAGPRGPGRHRPTPLHFVAPARVLSAFVQAAGAQAAAGGNCKLGGIPRIAVRGLESWEVTMHLPLSRGEKF